MKKHFSGIIVIFLFIFTNLYSQDGPGGIGSTDGTSNLKLWLRADKNVNYTALDTVTSWDDYSGNGLVLDSCDTGPTFSKNYSNSLPAIYFGQAISGLYYQNLDMDDLFSSDSNTIILVKNSTSGTGTRTLFNWEETAGTNLIRIDINGSNALETYFPDNQFLASSGSVTSSLNIFSTLIDVPLPNNNISLYINSSFNVDMSGTHGGNTLADGTANLYLGTADGTATNGWIGYLCEMLVYNTLLNSTERKIVENALSSKYNITLSGTDYYNGDATVNGDFDFDVVGIGQESDGSQTESNSAGTIIYTTGSNWDDGDYIFIGRSNMDNAATTDDCGLLGADGQRWDRSWYLEKTNSIDLKIAFDFSEGINGSPPASANNYELLYRATNSGDFSTVTYSSSGLENTDHVYFIITDANLNNGYYTFGTTDKTNSPVTGGQVWYSYTDGDWDNWETWTLDPDGSLLINSNECTPGAADSAIILNGVLVNVVFNDVECFNLEVRSGGILDLGTTTGHNFNSINGAGRIRLASDNFPAGDTTDFITHGTIEYTGAGTYNITSQVAYYNLEINLDNATDTIIMLDSLEINNDFTATQGVFQISGHSAYTDVLTLTVTGNITVDENGQISVGTGNTIGSYEIDGATSTLPATMGEYHKIYHQLYAYGNITVNGKIKLSNINQPDYANFTTTGGVSLYIKNATDNTFNIYDSTLLYNLIIDKGTDRTYILTVNSADNNFFQLYGPNNVSRFTGHYTSPFTYGDFELRKALWIYHGTLKLTGNIYIPSLCENSAAAWPEAPVYDPSQPSDSLSYDFAIGGYGALWIAGNNVKIQTTAVSGDVTATGIGDGGTAAPGQGMVLFGQLKVTAGTFTTRNSGGIFYQPGYSGEIILSDNGTITISQLRKSLSGMGKFSYIQSGGDLIIRGNTAVGDETAGGEINNGYGLFNINDGDCVFQMSGGNIYMYDNNTHTSDFEIRSDEGNYSVTGGKITISHNGGQTFDISSTANFWNLDIIRAGGFGSFEVNLDDDLTISNDLLIDDNTTFDIDNGGDNSLYIGSDLTIGSTTTSNANFGAGTNTTVYFTGSGNSIITITNTGTANVFDPEYMVIDKDIASAYVQLSSPGRTNNDAALIDNDFTISKGIFDYGPFTVEVQGNLNNSGTMGTDTASGYIELAGSGTQYTITTSVSGSPTYGHIYVNDGDLGDEVYLVNNARFKQLTLNNGVLDIGDYRLTVDTNFIGGPGFDGDDQIRCSGNHSARGLKLRMDATYSSDTDIDFPIGFGTFPNFTTISIPSSAGSISGYVTVVPVNSDHPAYSGGGGCSSIGYYWKVFADNSLTSVSEVDYSFVFTPSSAAGQEYYLEDTDWIMTDPNNGSPLEFEDMDFKTADFTAASNACFNGIRSFVSNCGSDPCDWDVAGSWTKYGTGPPDYPTSIDIAYILDGDTIHLTGNNQDVARLSVYNGGVLDINTRTGIDLLRVSGGGKIMIDYGSGAFPNGDFDEFLNNDTAIWEYYGNTTYTIPSTFTSIYPNLLISGSNGKTMPNTDIVVQKNLYIDDETVLLNSNNRDVEVYDSVIIDNAGILQFPNTGTCILKVNKSIDLAPDGSTDANTVEVTTGGAYTAPHSIIVYEDILMNDNTALTLFRNNGDKAINLYFRGDENSEITNSTSTDIALNYLYVEKNGLTDTITINSNFTLTDGTDRALELSTGTLILDNAGIDISLSPNDGDFTIPSDGELILRKQAKARITGNSEGLILQGKLTLEDTSQMILTDSTNAYDNFIEYSSSGYSAIVISDSAKLTVGSQIRRNTISTAGNLNYTQTGGSVTVGYSSAPETSRGVFEIVDNGSSNFTYTGGDLVIVRSASTNSPALYLNPTSYDVDEGTYITFGKVSITPNSDIIGMYINVPVKNIRTIDNTTGTFEAKIFTVALTLDTLNIAANTTFNCNEIDLFINGDFINAGTFNSNNNTTKFTGITKQHIISTGTSVFYNLSIQSGDTTFLDNDITVNNTLTIGSGKVFSDNQKTIRLLDNVTNSGKHYSPSTTLGGIWFNGTAQQSLTGTGTYGRLEIDNPEGIKLNNDFILVDNVLTFTTGNLYARQYSFTMGVNSGIAGSFGSSSMIITNGASSDKGVTKNLNSGTTTNILLPIGTISKYTPITINSISSSSSGSITVLPVNEPHPTATNKNNVLQYYWKINNSGLTNISADLRFTYVESDVSVTGANLESDYIPAYLEDAAWAKYGQGDVNATNNTIDFDFSGRSTIAGDFTAGIDTAIPDNVPVYITVANGNWENAAIWELEGGGSVSEYPDGYIVKIYHDVTISQNLKSAYKTLVDTGATLYIDSTIGHYLGAVSGYGHMRVKRGKLPAGNYDAFFACDGGSIEFNGMGVNYTIPDEGIIYRRLILSGSGTRILPDQDITICDTLIVDNTTLDNSPYDNTINIQGWFNLQNGGLFKCGTGTVIYNGSSTQTLGGFSGDNSFYNFEIDNSEGITLDGTVNIKKAMTLTDGVITTGTDTLLIKLTGINDVSPDGGKSSSYINGPMFVELDNGNSFDFPIGDNRWGKLSLNTVVTTGTHTWKAQYINGTHSDLDAGTGVAEVSTTEYWQVTQVTGATGTGTVEIRWDSQSDVNGISAGGVSNIRLAQYDGTTDWDAIGTSPSGTNYSGIVASDAAVTFNGTIKEFTLASSIALLASANFISDDTSICPGTSANLLVNLTGSDTWKLVWSVGGSPDSALNIPSSPYSITATTAGTYSLVRVYEDWDAAQTQGTVDVGTVTVTALPAVSAAAGADDAICSGDTINIGGSPAGSGGTGTLTYSWSPSTNLSSATIANPLAYPTALTTYVLTVTDENSCEDTDDIEVDVYALPIPNISADNTSICYGEGPIQFDSQVGMTTYSWSPADSLSDPAIQNPTYTPGGNPSTVSVTTTFTVTVTDANSCSDSESIDITVNRQPVTGNLFDIPNE